MKISPINVLFLLYQLNLVFANKCIVKAPKTNDVFKNFNDTKNSKLIDNNKNYNIKTTDSNIKNNDLNAAINTIEFSEDSELDVNNDIISEAEITNSFEGESDNESSDDEDPTNTFSSVPIPTTLPNPNSNFGYDGRCVVDPVDRIDCGDENITRLMCIEKGCCWGETQVAGAPWCFYSDTGNLINVCAAIEDEDKIACKATTEDECLSETSCCWKESDDETVPSCYHNRAYIPGTNPDAQITVRFLKPETWKVVNLWSWDGGVNLYGGPNWPGKAIEDLGNGWWSYTFPKGVTLANVIFNNGEADNTIKTYDITNVVTSTCFKLVGSAVIVTTDCGLDLEMCHADASERIKCGFDDLSEEECISLNCCYSELEGAPSCFHGVGSNYNNKYGTCNVEHQFRTQCGTSLDITESECIDLGCCWDISEVKGYPNCFTHGALVPTCSIDLFQRNSCGYTGISEDECIEKYGCCYDKNSLTQETICYFQDIVPSDELSEADCSDKKYKVKNLKKNSSGITATLDLNGQRCEKYDADFQTLNFAASFETNTRLHLKIIPTDIENYPHNRDIPKEAFPFVPKTEEISNPEYKFELKEEDDFEVIVKRKNDNIIFKSLEFVFEQQYLQITTEVPINPNIYGIGEVVSEFRRNANATRQALFALDSGCPKDSNIYGDHPFYLQIEDDGSAFGVFFKNAHGMDFLLEAGKLTFKVNGGNFDLYFFMGPTPEDVVAQYHKVIGQPALLGYWTLGWHQCRYGYKNIDHVESVYEKYKKNKIPLDTMWIDIDYMDGYKDFTYDLEKFPPKRISKFVDTLHKENRYYINMVDPAISTDSNYETYQRGIQADIFVKDSEGKNFIGKVWPGLTVYPDWFNPKVKNYWKKEFELFKNIAMTDGNWIDMNEASNFCNGACDGSSKDLPYKFGIFNPYNPPYAIFNNKNINTQLNFKTIDMDATHYGGHIEYDVHNLYGHMESIITNQVFRELDPVKRPFLLSRSTFAGTGAYAAHWLGDNGSTWDHLHWSIPGMLNFQMFGIPMVGADICGFNGNVSEELCARWHELGAFYPFARNHNAIDADDQEPYKWKSVAESARRALAIRYEILPYMYTLLIKTHTESGMIVYPQSFLWPKDSIALENDKQFLVGKGIMITPVLTQGATSVEGYFPAGKWYDWYDPTVSFQGPAYKIINAPLEHIPVHLRGGYIIPTQGPSLSVYENRNLPFGLIVTLDNEGKAQGELYLDDGISIEVNGKKSEIIFEANNGKLTGTGKYNYNEKQKLESIKILGVEMPSSVVVKQGKSVKSEFTYSNNVIIIKTSIDMNEDFTITWN